MTKHSKSTILRALAKQFHAKGRSLFGFNCYLYDWESDFLSISEKNLATEIEVKRTRSDFLRDKHKRKFKKLGSGFFRDQLPNYFSYACPVDVIMVSDLPHYAGLIYVREDGSYKSIKRPKLIHRGKVKESLKDRVYKSSVNFFMKNLLPVC